ncbi:MAG: TFIIB-type zinc ribbon-containing protein [Candidatus Woesearchaeota archaeon]
MVVETIKKCPECGENHFFANKKKGEVICKDCGFVVEDSQVDFGRDRMINMEDIAKKSRTGAPYDPRIANGLMTEVGSNADLRNLSKKQRQLMNRIRQKNRWTSSALEHNLNTNLANLKLIASQLKIPDSIEKEAARVYRECAEKGVTRARANDSIIAAVVYLASKLHGMPKTLTEVARASKLDKFDIARTYKMIIRRLGIKVMQSNPIDFIARFASELKLGAQTQTKAVKLLEKIQKTGIDSGKSPTSLAATTLYIAALQSKTRVTQKAIAETAGITETTLRQRTKEMLKKLGIKKSDIKKK